MNVVDGESWLVDIGPLSKPGNYVLLLVASGRLSNHLELKAVAGRPALHVRNPTRM